MSVGTAGGLGVPSSGQHPEAIGRYRLDGILGEGAFGRVYKAWDPELRRVVAIKVPLDQRASQLAVDEARKAASLEHPAIVPVYDVGEVDNSPPFPAGIPYAVFRYVDGKTLADAMAGEGIPPGRSAEILYRVAEGLAHAHSAGVIHRDLKPANILLDAEGCPHIADFGIAALMDDLRRQAPDLAGTLPYMSPEQIQGGSLDGRTDIWGLGIILYQLLARKLPFEADDPTQLMVQILDSSPVPPSQIAKDVPGELERICLKCLNKLPDNRYLNASDLAQELCSVFFLEGRTRSCLRLTQVSPATGNLLAVESHARFVTIGRAPKNLVRLQDSETSWEHGVICLLRGAYSYRHLSGTNPATLRRKGEAYLLRRGQLEEIELRNQDRLTIGATTLVVEFDLLSEDTGYVTTDKQSK